MPKDKGMDMQHSTIFETIGGSHGAPQRGMCLQNYFSGLNGSKARFIDVEEPASIIGNVPNAEDFIKGANDWLTIKDGISLENWPEKAFSL